MPLLVEDGTGIANANSFIELADARAYATLRGVSLDAPGVSDSVLTGYLVNASSYIAQKRYLGTKTYPGEEYLPWPRAGLYVDDVEYSNTAIPIAIKNAVAQLAIEQKSGLVLYATTLTPGIKREKIGPIDTEYAMPTSGVFVARIPIIDAMLSDWLAPYSFGLRTLRI